MTAPQRKLSTNLDLLRAVAVTAVFVNHLAETVWHSEGFDALGRFGVILFFVHTSYVLMASLDRMKRSSFSDRLIPLAFWSRRFFRIYPLAILCVLTVVALHVPYSPLRAYHWIGLRGFLSNLALAQNLTSNADVLSPLWTIPLEVQMYLILPFAFFAIRGSRYLSLPLWFFSLLPMAVFYWIPALLPLRILLFMPCFAAGIVAFDLKRSKGATHLLPDWVWPVGVLGLLAIFGPYDKAGFSEKYLQCWGLALALGVLYPFVKDAPAGWFYRVCHWVAEHSYGIYLSHCIVLWVAFNLMRHFPLWIQIPVLVSGVIGIPALLYAWLERPFIEIGVGVANRILSHAQPEQIGEIA